MIDIDKVSVCNMENAIRGARNPLNSWEKSDSAFKDGVFVLGENDLNLARRLCAAGSDHRKFIRQIFVSADITAPLYWWKEFDTYKVGTVANSTSTMHKIHAKPFEMKDFSFDRLDAESREMAKNFIDYLEQVRLKYVETKDKTLWYNLIQLLPSSYHQMRTVTMNYENLTSMYYARRAHKLDEWRRFCEFIETLPYARDMIITHE